MAKAEFFLGAVAKRLNLVIVHNEIAVWPKQIVGHEICVVGRREDLAREGEQSLAHLKGESEMIEGVKLVNEYKCGVVHPAHPEEQQFQVLCSGGSQHIKGNPFSANEAEEDFVISIGLCKVEILSADFVQEFLEILHEIVLDNVLVQHRGVCLQSDELPDVQASEPQHAVDELLQAKQVVVRCQRIGREQEIDDRNIVRIVCEIPLDALVHRKRFLINEELSGFPAENLFPLYEHLFTLQQSTVVFAIAVFHNHPVKNEGVVKLYVQGLIAGIDEVDIIIRFLPFLGKVIDDIENGKAEIGFPGSVGTVDNAVLDDVVLDGVGAEIIVAVTGQVQLDFFGEASEIFYGEFGKHVANSVGSEGKYNNIILNFRNFFTEIRIFAILTEFFRSRVPASCLA